MNPLLQQALLAILRWAMAIAAGYFVKAGIWSAPEATQYVAAASLALLSLVWTQRVIIRNRVKFLVGLMMPKGSTEADVKQHIELAKVTGDPLPSVNTPPDTAPGVPKP